MSIYRHLFRSRSPLLWGALVLCLAASRGLALDPGKSIFQYNCRTWTRQNGLPAGGVNAIAQTADGYLWLGTAAGLVSFDGIEFKSHDLSHLQSRIVTSLARSSDGGLWLGLGQGSFAYFDGQNVTSQGREAWGGVNLSIQSILETPDHAVWLGAETQFATLSKEHLFKTLNDFDTTALMQDSKGRIWIGTAHRGLFWWENGTLTQFPGHAVDNQEIRALAMDTNGWIWIGTDWGPMCYDSNYVRKNFPSPWYPTRALLVDREGTLWMGTTGSGLIKYQNGTTTAFRKQDGLADDKVAALAEDQEGNLWVGTQDGLSQFTDVKIPTFTKTEGIPAEVIVDVSASRRGGLWLASGQGFAYFDGKGSSTTTLLGLTNEYVNRILEANNGDVYVVNGYKEIEILRGGKALARYPNSDWPICFAEDKAGVVVGIGSNLYRVGTNYFSPFQFAGGANPGFGWVFNMASGRDGCLWLATGAGICRIKDGVPRLWTTNDGIPENTVICVCEDNEGVVWAGFNKGMARLKDGRIVSVSRKQGLFDEIIHSILPDDDGHIWVDSSRGFFSFATRDFEAFAGGNAERLVCAEYTGLGGVKSSERLYQKDAGCRTLDGRIWFPTSDGVVMIDPNRMNNIRSVPPRIYIQNTRANGQELKPGETKARPGKGDLEFQYAGLSYIAPQQIRYRYMLQGYDKEWVEAGMRRSAFYTNLKPGQYRFLVQACNEDGVWSPAAASVDVELLPHFYQTGWFIFLVVAAFLAVLFGLYTWRLKHLTNKQRQLQKSRDLLELKVAERTRELRQEIEQRKRVQAEIDIVNRELVDASRRAGQAEVATSVLHNVGNVLNSVNTSAGVVTGLMRGIPGDGISKFVGLLEEHRASLAEFLSSDNRADSAINYLRSLNKHLAAQQVTILSELQGLSQNIEHINQIVAMQQNYASVSGAVELQSLAALVEDALRLHAAGFERHDVRLVREYEELPDILIDKHKVLQILVNLISNAKYAVCHESVLPRLLTVRIHRNSGDFVQVSVSDSGVGIDAANLTRIFAHGFTTRKDGHGFGLHSGALAAREMGGSLRAESKGLGKGATFTLELPLQPAETPAAAEMPL
ncbi:MAG: two-component regulator propeller domain-containing protein [Verrucomicrobiota bacterium]